MNSKTITQRINSIDALRGLVIILMLLDHVRERFFYNHPVADPMILETTEPGLFWSRFAAHFCAPIFVFLTGLSAWLYQQKHDGSPSVAREFLWKRGLFLVILELTVINFSWFGAYETLYLQVIWVIGLCMLILGACVNLPYRLLFVLGLLIVAGHNALDFIHLKPGEWGYTAWTILHDRGYILQSDALSIRASYPLLPWIGVILLGYAAGPLYSKSFSSERRAYWLLGLTTFCLAGFLLLRGFNIYGETQAWSQQESLAATARAIFNVTKYPPSLNFLQITFAGMFAMLYLMERLQGKWTEVLTAFGGAPMFFYIVHLYVLLLLYTLATAVLGAPEEGFMSLPNIYWVWLTTIVLAALLYKPTQVFNRYKRRSNKAWVKYL
ncbi:UNVERIFIED_ORG: putative membrane protein [Idiomarina abyssalis]|uniref:Uncharacterized conserved membrane protein n=1 Tax=Idiomarina loihiensis (strain ATCC BAA-735 / DSM 15497 / L2-TR) TaxID=283942 RepID=Q5QZE6_IDILO|nr:MULTISPECIES: heparan-alpha-glucosaminide N-acetyltransferase domain-containing protein [Idiomarina]AAV83421.1 Uncharacterized conserved membrane protein [Idiomarina loihiensis L2TR]AGM37464.1 hypothetical protein K734_13025 [Idiomarina loihiensis GSL 199]NWO02199.1 DUF1624 domain-containing protein [Idiomarinaceae bacterium]TDO45203.1 putative membrane protein [Idiomarina sp. 017G]